MEKYANIFSSVKEPLIFLFNFVYFFIFQKKLQLECLLFLQIEMALVKISKYQSDLKLTCSASSKSWPFNIFLSPKPQNPKVMNYNI